MGGRSQTRFGGPDDTAALCNRDGPPIVTEWEEIATLDEEFDRMATPLVIDGRRAIARRDGLVYEGLTW